MRCRGSGVMCSTPVSLRSNSDHMARQLVEFSCAITRATFPFESTDFPKDGSFPSGRESWGCSSERETRSFDETLEHEAGSFGTTSACKGLGWLGTTPSSVRAELVRLRSVKLFDVVVSSLDPREHLELHWVRPRRRAG